MSQYVPEVSEADVHRIVRSDYPAELHETIDEMIQAVDVREKARVILACLKNAKRDFQKLRGELTNASGYWREIIAEAEYPNYTKQWLRIQTLDQAEQERIIEKDKDQYLKWLHGDRQ